MVFLLRWFSWIGAKSSLLEAIRVLSRCWRGWRLEQSWSECHSGRSVGTSESSGDSQSAYGADSQTSLPPLRLRPISEGLFEIGIFTASPVRLIGKSFLLSQLCGDCLSGDYSFLHCCLPVIVPYYRQTRAREAAKCTKLQENFASYTPTTEKQAFPKGAFPFPSAAAINYKD